MTRRLLPGWKVAERIPWLLLTVIVSTIGVRLLLPAVGTFRDDGIYISSARALASGRGYVIDILPGSPPNTKYPPLTSALLAIPYMLKFAPLQSPTVFKLIPFLFLLIWLAGLWSICNEAGIGTAGKGLILCLTASENMVAYCSTMPLSDVVSSALVTWSLLYIVRALAAGPGQALGVGKAGLLLGLSVLTRSANLAALVGIVCVLMAMRRVRYAAILAAVVSGVALPWLMWAWSHYLVGESALAYYSLGNYADWWVWRTGSIGTVVSAMLWNCYIFLTGPAIFLARELPLLTLLLCMGLFVIAMLSECSNPVRPVLAGSAVALVLMASLWLWLPVRILMPVYPLLYVLIAGGRHSVGVSRLLAMMSLLLCLTNVWNLVKELPDEFRSGTPSLLGRRGDDWQTLKLMAGWLSKSTARTETIGSLQDGALSLLSGRPVVFPAVVKPESLFYGGAAPPVGTVAEFVTALRNWQIRFVALTPSWHFAEAPHFREIVRQTTIQHSGCFRVAADFGGGYQIYEWRCGWAVP